MGQLRRSAVPAKGLMSALGHKRTYAVQKAMSALHPIATAKAKFRKKPCLLYPPAERLVFNRSYLGFQAFVKLMPSALWFVCRCLPCVSRDILVAHADR